MRIISGTLGSRRLLTVEGEGYRPAMGKVRESLFSILSHRLNWQGLRVLDLYAGSGSLAFEALSRGAAAAWLVELAAPACRCIKANIRNLGLEGRAFLVQENVLLSAMTDTVAEGTFRLPDAQRMLSKSGVTTSSSVTAMASIFMRTKALNGVSETGRAGNPNRNAELKPRERRTASFIRARCIRCSKVRGFRTSFTLPRKMFNPRRR